MKDWLKDIQEKVGNYEVRPSEDLMRKLEAKGIIAPEGRRVLPVWARYAVPCAAALAFLFLIGKSGVRTEDNPIAPAMGIASYRPELLAEAAIPRPKALYLKEKVTVEQTIGTEIQPSGTEDNQASDAIIPDRPAAQSPEVEEKTGEQQADISVMNPFASPDEYKSARKPSVSLALLGAIGTQSGYSPQIADIQEQYTKSSGADWGGTPVMAMMLCSASAEMEEEMIEEEYAHRLPLKFGISVEYSMNDRWSVTSGLSYSFLVSDIYDSNGNTDKLGVQKLSYLGIPANVKFNAFRTGMFNMYLTAGGIAEYCIAGLRENICDVSGTKTNSTDKYSEHPFQLSVNASAGAEHSFLGYMSLFAEVGASYHFDDGSGIQTIYKERPLYLNTNVGVRFNFGRSR